MEWKDVPYVALIGGFKADQSCHIATVHGSYSDGALADDGYRT